MHEFELKMISGGCLFDGIAVFQAHSVEDAARLAQYHGELLKVTVVLYTKAGEQIGTYVYQESGEA